MKAKLSLIFFLLISYSVFSQAQVPQGFNYQAVARDGSGKELLNQYLRVRVAIMSDVVRNVVIWEEEHTLTTNNFGQMTLVIGDPLAERVVGGNAESFSLIDWTIQPLYLRTMIYINGSWLEMGASQLWTVPYSMVSGNLRGTVNKLQVKGSTANMEEALFEVKNKDGQTIFAVYNEGVRVYVSDGDAKGIKGGFAIGGFNMAKGVGEYFRVTKDSTRVYLNDTGVKTQKGGFAIGGFDLGKGTIQDYLQISQDSIRMYVNDNPVKGIKGGFAIGGFNNNKANTPNFMSLTRENYFIGHETGKNTTTGIHNMFFGYQSGLKNTTGSSNIFIGELTGSDNLYGYNNVFLGYNAGKSNIGTTYSDQGSNNVYIGTNSGKVSTLGVSNTFVGSNSGAAVTSGVSNTFIGSSAGLKSLNCSDNTFIGVNAGKDNTTGAANVVIGKDAGTSLSTGSRNILIGNSAGNTIFYANDNILIGNSAGRLIRNTQNTIIGHNAGYSLQYSSGNVMLGYMAGYSETGDNKLYIENSSSTVPLIGGDFANNRVGINIMPTTHTLEVGGTMRVTGALNFLDPYSRTITSPRYLYVNAAGEIGGISSSLKYKENVFNLEDISWLFDLRPVTYNYKNTSVAEIQYGLIAEEVDNINPLLVIYGSDNKPDGLMYERLVVPMLKALQEQKKQIESTTNENLQLKSDLKSLREEIDLIKAMVVKNVK
jgi:hypothetical protein